MTAALIVIEGQCPRRPQAGIGFHPEIMVGKDIVDDSDRVFISILPHQQKGNHRAHGADAVRFVIRQPAVPERQDFFDTLFQYVAADAA